jgi:transposase
MTVQITRRDHDADSLREHASRVSDASVVRRLLALALVLEGHSRAAAAKTCGMDRQTLRDWFIRYNEPGDRRIIGPSARRWCAAEADC